MSDDSAMTPEPAASAGGEAPRRSRLPWVLLGIGGVLLLALGIVVAVVVIPSFVGGSADPVATVEEFDRSYAEVDCELFQAVTTEGFRRVSQGSDDAGVFDCASWEEIAAEYTVDGEYRYDLEVLDATVADERAVVQTEESDLVSGDDFAYTYTLVPDAAGDWVIESIVETED